MDAVSEDLLKPLGLDKPVPSRWTGLPAMALPLGAGLLGAGLLALLAALALPGDPGDGEPAAAAGIVSRAPEAAPAARPVGSEQPVRVSNALDRRVSATELEGASGVAVVRPAGPGAPPEAVIIRLPDAPGSLVAAPDPRLVERARHGVLPRKGRDGARALEVYARPPGPATSGPRIALVVTGLGIGQTATGEAIAKLPAPVSLAFAPYGGELEGSVARAREAGHEVMLQAPMEPFDYPDNDPGPHTLLTDGKPAEASDRLHWIMSRFSGYIGIVNFMGAKLMANDAALSALLREAGARGLGFVDDGSSPRSLAASVGAKVGTPTVRADAVIDAVPRGDAVERELSRLEALARTKGVAVGSASALPMTVERIARWAAGLEAKGIRLVPVSSVLLADPGR